MVSPVFQLEESSTAGEPLCTVISVSPETLATETVTAVFGSEVSITLKSAVFPSLI